MSDFTDLRILGGSRRGGGGVDTQLRIKLPAAMKSGIGPWQRENEDPAKMTHSIMDFLGHHGPKKWPSKGLRNDPEAGWELRNRTPLWDPDFLMVSQDCMSSPQSIARSSA